MDEKLMGAFLLVLLLFSCYDQLPPPPYNSPVELNPDDFDEVATV